MADEKPKFDPTKPFQIVSSKPRFDPNKPFEVVPKANEEPVLDEQADVPWEQRLAVKNFGGSLDEQIGFLQRENPDFQFKEYDNGEIVAKKSGETSWKRLDPGGVSQYFKNPSEIVQDATDVGYDLLSSGLTSMAGASGGLFGSIGGPVGALASGAAASAAAGGGLEAVRQAIGSRIGTATISPGNIGLAAGLSALGPLVFGPGNTKKQIAEYVAKPGVGSKILDKFGLGYVKPGEDISGEQLKAAGKFVEDSQKSLLGYGKTLFGTVISGSAPKETLENATEYVSQKMIDDLIASGLELNPTRKYTNQEIAIALTNQEKMSNFGDMASNTVYQVINDKKNEIGTKIADALEKSGEKFDVSKLKDGLEAVIEKSEKSQIPAIREQASAARKIANEYFTPRNTQKFYDDVGNEIVNLKSHSGPVYDEADNLIERRTLRAGIATEITPTQAMELSNALSAYLDYTKNPISVEKMSAAEKMLRGVVGDAKERLQEMIYDAAGKSGDDGLKYLYRENRDFFRNIFPKFSTPEKAVSTLNNLNNPGSRILKERIKNFDKKYTTNITDLGNLANVTKFFGDTSMLEAISSGGATSTGKVIRSGDVGASLGYMAGLGTGIAGAAPAAATVGRAVGGAASGPAAVGKYLQGVTALKRASEATGADELIKMVGNARDKIPGAVRPSFTAPGIYQSTWRLMGGNK